MLKIHSCPWASSWSLNIALVQGNAGTFWFDHGYIYIKKGFYRHIFEKLLLFVNIKNCWQILKCLACLSFSKGALAAHLGGLSLMFSSTLYQQCSTYTYAFFPYWWYHSSNWHGEEKENARECMWHHFPSNYDFNPHWKQLNHSRNPEDLVGSFLGLSLLLFWTHGILFV